MAALNGERRAAVLGRDHFTCVYCGSRLPEDDLTVDHVEPRMRGGDSSLGNLVTACRACNRAKAGRPAWQYLRDRPEEREHFLAVTAYIWPRLRRAIEEAPRKIPGQE